MTKNMGRREFVASSLIAGAAIRATAGLAEASVAAVPPAQELYELRIYRNTDAARQSVVLHFVENALRPALNRQGIDRVGIFVPKGSEDASVYVVIPYATPTHLTDQNDRLEKDEVYHKAAASFFSLPKNEAPYTRIDSRLLRAFAGMPVLAAPSTSSASRIVELRIYESHNAHLAKRKVEMFNQGEIDIMRDVALGPVFFGETLISSDVPNLTYMLSAESDEAHKKHWAAFLKHPEWARMSKLARYKGTVSKIVSVTMTPTAASQF